MLEKRASFRKIEDNWCFYLRYNAYDDCHYVSFINTITRDKKEYLISKEIASSYKQARRFCKQLFRAYQNGIVSRYGSLVKEPAYLSEGVFKVFKLNPEQLDSPSAFTEFVRQKQKKG